MKKIIFVSVLVFLAISASILLTRKPVGKENILPEIADTTFAVRGKPFTSTHEISLLHYEDDAMEPGISSDGMLLFFNNNGEDKDVFVARRVADSVYDTIEGLSEVNSSSVDSSPEVVADSIFFTSLADYPHDRKTLFRGNIRDGKVREVMSLQGNLYSKTLREISLDPDLTANEEILFFAEGRFGTGSAPEAMDIRLAYKTDDATYTVPENSDEILRNINTDDLEYAPAISSDGREIFFTRATKSAAGAVTNVQILQAVRNTLDQAFGTPEVVRVADGFVEGPSLSPDGKSLYYHKKVGDRFVIFVAQRD